MGALVNALFFTGLALALGAVGQRYLVMTRAGLSVSERAPVQRDLARAGLWGAALVLLAAPARVLLQAWGFAEPGEPVLPVARTVLTSTAIGKALLLQAIWAAAAAMAFASARFGRQRGWSAAAMSVLVLAVVPGLTGHAAAAEQRTIALVAATVHVIGVGIWIGGLFHLWRITGPASEATLARMLQAFHAVALTGAAMVGLSGLTHVFLQVRSPSQLWTTTWGVLLLAKLTVLGGVIALGYRHWRGGESMLGSGTREALRRSIGREALLALVVLAITGILTSTSPE